jgi:hypothetical protein
MTFHDMTTKEVIGILEQPSEMFPDVTVLYILVHNNSLL